MGSVPLPTPVGVYTAVTVAAAPGSSTARLQRSAPPSSEQVKSFVTPGAFWSNGIGTPPAGIDAVRTTVVATDGPVSVTVNVKVSGLPAMTAAGAAAAANLKSAG